MASILRFISIASLLGGLLAALASHPYFLQAAYLLASGVVCAAVFWWMAGVYESVQSAAASLRVVASAFSPTQAPIHGAAGTDIAVGAAVRHAKYGEGEVVSAAGDGMALVKFSGGHQAVNVADLGSH